MAVHEKKSLGQAIDTLIDALESLDDSSRLIVVKAACEHLNIHLESSGMRAATPLTPPTPNVSPAQESGTIKSKITDIRSLKDSKKPSNAIEMVCLVAYYLENHAPEKEKKSEILRTDVEKYFKQASFPLPKVPEQVLTNAKAAGYFDSVGHGKYKLNPVGHNLVAHSLPRAKEQK
jgi:hypothetical protein